MINPDRIQLIEQKLTQAFQPELLLIEDESHQHIGHPGAKTGLGHFKVTITAKAFAGHSRVTIHRMIYEALGSLMQTDIHALTIIAKG